MTTCTECGFPTDTPERPHAFIHQLMEALIEHRKILPELRKAEAELAALREALLDARPFIADHLPIKGRIERLLITESPARDSSEPAPACECGELWRKATPGLHLNICPLFEPQPGFSVHPAGTLVPNPNGPGMIEVGGPGEPPYPQKQRGDCHPKG
jgi:hypothetical protein